MGAKRKGIPAAERAAVRERSGGICETCHRKPAINQHHRRFLSRGGADTVENLLDLCGFGNTSGCHGRAHGAYPLDGTAISRYDDRPDDEIPFVDSYGYIWQLHRDGTKTKIGQLEAA